METTERKLLLLQTVDLVLGGASVCNLTGREFQKSEESLADRVASFYRQQHIHLSIADRDVARQAAVPAGIRLKLPANAGSDVL